MIRKKNIRQKFLQIINHFYVITNHNVAPHGRFEDKLSAVLFNPSTIIILFLPKERHCVILIFMNGYDFDDTIIKGNCWRSFYFYCLLHFPYIALLLVVQVFFALFYLLHLIDNRKFSSVMSWYLVFIPHKEKVVERFWDKNQKRVKKWYLNQHQDDDFVISASPRFLVEPMCKRLGIKCIASEMNIRTGQYVGPYYYGPMKVYAYEMHFKNAPLKAYYSDSFTDTPMWKICEEGWLVEGEKVTMCYKNGEPLEAYQQHKRKKYWRL